MNTVVVVVVVIVLILVEENNYWIFTCIMYDLATCIFATGKCQESERVPDSDGEILCVSAASIGSNSDSPYVSAASIGSCSDSICVSVASGTAALLVSI